MVVKNKFELADTSQKTEDSLTQTLKAAFQTNTIYSRISDSTYVAINPYKSFPNQSLQYVAEYKDTGSDALEPLPTHIYKLTNQAYLHMRRTGIDQSIIFNCKRKEKEREALVTDDEAYIHTMALSFDFYTVNRKRKDYVLKIKQKRSHCVHVYINEIDHHYFYKGERWKGDETGIGETNGD
ncbi:uncharacterized protein B0P05DRAFT_368593 [Gilbertella persicaria]|uniref:uncharacterized protein n=1 Tax=Gilbertella persicaria TaxID=101096 RepID=UPI00221FA67C|nr:uncharacterized protein B0P05DRAFT_368593 [Gilbertella persicaria]KAI8087609.1 hypothetical protein B0P05DRAFT_368593 [Gilbertella persicaria]